MFDTSVSVNWIANPDTGSRKGEFTAPNERVYIVEIKKQTNKNIEQQIKTYHYLTEKNKQLINNKIITAIQEDKIWEFSFYDKEYAQNGDGQNAFTVNDSGTSIQVWGIVLNIIFDFFKEIPGSVFTFTINEKNKSSLFYRFGKDLNIKYQELRQYTSPIDLNDFIDLWYIWVE